MSVSSEWRSIVGTEHQHPVDHRVTGATPDDTLVTVSLILHRRSDAPTLPGVREFTSGAAGVQTGIPRDEFSERFGADPAALNRVAEHARASGLEVIETNAARRTVVVHGPASAINRAFNIKLNEYSSPRGQYHGHESTASLPADVADDVQTIVGLDSRPVQARHFSTRSRRNPADPPETKSLTPQQVASLYNFPESDGTGQTIGIYEMATQDGPAGYSIADLTDTINAFGGGLPVPKPIDVPIDGVGNSGLSDGETGLDITVAGAIAPGAEIAVYFAGGDTQAITRGLQRMIHPGAGDPVPSIVSISYGFGPDDASAGNFTDPEYTVIEQLFQDAANLKITVLVSSGDSGAQVLSPTQAQTSYPSTDPLVTSCGGTTIGAISGPDGPFTEYVWNDRDPQGNPGGTGGGISARYPVPAYQSGIQVPVRNGTGIAGRGVPDIAGNASENSGYIQFIKGKKGSVGGTSAVAPLYAGLIARINAILGSPVGFLNPTLYAAASNVCRVITGPPGPPNNSFGHVQGYPATAGWNACTGLGVVNGTELLAALRNANPNLAPGGLGVSTPPGPGGVAATSPAGTQTVSQEKFTSGPFRGVPINDAFADAASNESPVVVSLAPVVWPDGLAPAAAALGAYTPGQKITEALQAQADVLIVLYTTHETQALLEVFTGDNTWNAERQAKWFGYAHNFDTFKPTIEGIADDPALSAGIFGYLAAMTIGSKKVVLFKSELHPKVNGPSIPFIPVLTQLMTELSPALVLTTGTAGAVGNQIKCGDVAITSKARFHCRETYPDYPQIAVDTTDQTELTNTVPFNPAWVQFAAANFTKLSLPGLSKCFTKLQQLNGYGFVEKNVVAPTIYITGVNNATQPMDIVSADYLTVDDQTDAEGLQALGVMNDTDDAFLVYAIQKVVGAQPKWLSVRNASEPQIVAPPFAPGASPDQIINKLKGIAGSIYGIYQYCTTLNSAFACWGVIAGL